MSTVAVQPFRLPHGHSMLAGDRWTLDSARGEALILHGGGSSSSQGFQALREHLAAEGIASTAFDCIGHGRTGGALADSSLADRVEQVLNVMDGLALDAGRLTVIGFSMGAYVAAQVSARRRLAGLGQAIPAAYTPEALPLPFGPSFAACIRRPRSWADSDAFEILQAFTGRLLVLSAGADQVIPAEIPERLFEAALRASWRRHHRVEGAGHQLAEHYAREPTSQRLAYRQFAALCGA
ncbi:MAG TPA: alpha/beta fold hydrolase [Roseateles sp.]|nr:alpha/beta fold hydrolase [Roseateles sp.]